MINPNTHKGFGRVLRRQWRWSTARLFLGFSSSSFPTMESSRSVSPSSVHDGGGGGGSLGVGSDRPFSGLVICVTGLSKEARKQVRDATEGLGGHYSPNLHPQCTHLVVQSFGGRKFDHAMKHGVRNGLFVVTLGWFVDSVRENVRLSESLYHVKSTEENDLRVRLNHLVRVSDTEKSCMPVGLHEDTIQSNLAQETRQQYSGKDSGTSRDLVLSGHSMYVDSKVSDDVRRKVIDAATNGGVAIINPWFIGCSATHVVCEGPSVWRYLGHTDNVVTPQWILKSTKENYAQKLVCLSADLARQVSGIVENFQNDIPEQSSMEHSTCIKSKESLEERQQVVELAKAGVRNRRRRHVQKTQIRPITPSTLMDTICWSISDPAGAACVYADLSRFEDHSESASEFFDAKGDGRGQEASFENLHRPLRESEKSEKILKNPFLTILFPIDRFGEMGPSSRTFFSNNGFTLLQLLDYIHTFYQENMAADEVVIGIHTDSKHADRLRSVYASNESLESGNVQFKRIEFLGSRTSFEMLKRVSGDNSSSVYELLIRA